MFASGFFFFVSLLLGKLAWLHYIQTMFSYAKTALLLAAMSAIFMAVGYGIGGGGGMAIAFVIAARMSFFSYWNADKMVLKRYRAKPIDADTAPQLHVIIDRLCANAQMPRPKSYIIDNPQPNAFATGRDPDHAAIAVTTGLLEKLSMEEIAGVVAHELAHIQNRDTLIMTVSATISGAIGMLANLMMFSRSDHRGGAGLMILTSILAPIAAMVVQMTISRTREYEADRIGAEICGQPNDLADALEKIANIAPRIQNETAEAHPETAHMFIFSPFAGGLKHLFSTHPDPAERIRRLRAMETVRNRDRHQQFSSSQYKNPMSEKTGPWE